MLDLIIFASAIAIANYASRKNPLLSPSYPILAGDRGADGRRVVGAATADDPVHRFSRRIFHGCLVLSLLLFSLSMLEAAPVSWLVLIDRASLFVSWYRALLWALCVLLLFVHPLTLGAVAGASIFSFIRGPSSSSATGMASTGMASTAPPSPGRNNNKNPEGRRSRGRRTLVICWNILRIGVRFFLVTILWRLLRRVAAAIVPYRITRVDCGSGNKRKQRKYWTTATTSIVVSALVSLYLSFTSLATIGSLVLHFDAADADGFVAAGENGDARHVKSALESMVSILCAFGMIVASVMNGFGCASLPHANLVGAFLKPAPPSAVSRVEDDFHYATKTLEEKRLELAEAVRSSSSAARRAPSKRKITAEKRRIKQLRGEIVFLHALVGDMNADIEEMKQSQRLALVARTTSGRIRGILGVVFSVVLVVRVVLAARSFASAPDADADDAGAPNSRDPLTTISLWLLGRNIVRTQEQYDLFRQGTSLVLAGALGASQVRAFLRVAGALGRRLSRTCGGASLGGTSATSPAGRRGAGRGGTPALLLSSFVMGCYFLACVTVVKMTLPVEYRSSFSTAMGLNFRFNTRLLNMIFFGSACVSAIALASLFGIQRNNSYRYQLESQLSKASLQLV